jgi:pyrimidine operon attenuation protein/uracil phosphoribosyltransferase
VENHLILDKKQTIQKIKRIAFEIYENNFNEKELIVAGIYDKGYLLAQLLVKELETISPIKIQLIKVSLDKSAPLQSEISLDCDINTLKNKQILIVDDVLNSGRTLAYSLKPFLNIEIKRLQIAVLVDRGYKSFPVAADYTGYALSTTLKEHIEVILNNESSFGVYLK